ncbi:MAG: nucleotidyl transferase AbiEii/AbiGii toxin family protein [bacterium]|nr:nucleotidyl transferase AbiEii/AbiGii toxin family protein [bacterium]
MIQNIQNYARTKGLSERDALQVFMQVLVLKNLHLAGAKMIGGTALVMGHGNPRFSEDIDLTGVLHPSGLKKYLEKGAKELGGLLNCGVTLKAPKEDRITWVVTCRLSPTLSARLHVDSQPYKSLTQFPLMVEYPGQAPFVFPSVTLDEIMADKLVALAFRNNLSGRDIFDLWYHWLKGSDADLKRGAIQGAVEKKLRQRGLKVKTFLRNIREKMTDGVTKRVQEEWGRYLPSGLDDPALHERIFETVKELTLRMSHE